MIFPKNPVLSGFLGFFGLFGFLGFLLYVFHLDQFRKYLRDLRAVYRRIGPDGPLQLAVNRRVAAHYPEPAEQAYGGGIFVVGRKIGEFRRSE